MEKKLTFIFFPRISSDMTGKQLKRWQEKTGWTIQALADRIQVTRQTVMNWREGRRPIPETMVLAMKALEEETD